GQGKLDVYRQAPGHGEDEESDEGAVLTAERQRDDDALMLELEAAGRQQPFARLGLADEPARQHRQMRAVGAALAAYRTAEAVLLPVDQGGPGRSAGPFEFRGDLVERVLTAERSAGRVDDGLHELRPAGPPPDVEQEPEEADRGPDEGDLDLAERGRDERKRETGDRNQLLPVAQVARARDHGQAVGNGGVAKLGEFALAQD